MEEPMDARHCFNDATFREDMSRPPEMARRQQKKEEMKNDRMSSARADIEQRVSQFRATQARLQREREGFYDTVIEKVRATEWNEFVTPHSAPKS